MKIRSLAYLLIMNCLSLGCSGKPPVVPVDEVTADSSGIQLTDETSKLGPHDWPSWRGPLGDGHAMDQELPTEWSSKKNVAWTTDVPGRGHGSPIVVGDMVFLAAAFEQSQKQLVVAYDRDNGEQLWQTELHSGGFPTSGELHQKGTNANSTIASDGEHLFIAFLNSKKILLSKIDLDGKIVWQKEVGAFASKFGYAPSPVVYKAFVIVAADNFGGGYIAALDKNSGTVAWRKSRAVLSSFSSPAILKVDGEDQLVISGCKTIDSYDPATGKSNWSIGGFVEATCGTCVTDGKYIFASGGYPEKLTFCVNGSGKEIWSNRNRVYEPSMLVLDKHLIAIDDKGIVSCFDLKTGESHWRERLDEKVSASPVVCNGVVYASTLSGNTHLFKVSSEGMERIATNRLGDDTYASPAISENAIFLRTGSGSGSSRKESLHCIK